MATIADVARAAGVSITTVSRVLSPGAVPHPVAVDTAERVRAAARDLRFVPSEIARGLAAGRSGLVGLIVPDLADPHYPHIASGVEDGAREAELAVLICNTLGATDRLREYLQLLEARRVDAVVLSGATSLTASQLLALRDCEVPLVLIGRPATPVPWPHVSIDNKGGAQRATRHLIALGYQHIVHLAGPRQQTTMADRAQGYVEEMMRRTRHETIETNGTPDNGYQLLRERLNRGPEVEAVFAATDRLAVAALALAADRGLHVPRDLGIVGFDDIPLAAQLRPSLSSVAQPAHDLGRIAIGMAQGLIAGDHVQPVVLPTRLVERQSTMGYGPPYSRA